MNAILGFENGYFYVPRDKCGPVPQRLKDGWVGEGIPTLPKFARQLTWDGNLITRDAFLAAQFISNATPQAKSELVRLTSWSWAHEAKMPTEFPAGVVPYNYQTIGVNELIPRHRALLADDMGLGKTLQIIGLINKERSISSVLVICPATIRLNWQREFAMFSTRHDLKVMQIEAWVKAGAPKGAVVIVNYELLGPKELRKRTPNEAEKAEMEAIKGLGLPIEEQKKRLKAVRDKISLRMKEVKDKRKKRDQFLREDLRDHAWDLVALDEAHYIKDPKSQRSKAIWGLLMQAQPKARAVFATGTPITKNPLDFQMILEMIDKVNWSWPRFTSTYCEFGHNNQVDKRNFRNLDVLNCRLRLTCMIRRLKDHVLADLPPKVRRLVPIETSGSAGKGSGMASLSRAEATQAKLDWDAISRSGRPIFDRDARAAAEHEINEAFSQLATSRQELGVKKVPSVVAFTTDFLEAQPEQKVIIFATHRAVVAALEAGLSRYGVVKVVGGMSAEAKQASVDAFQGQGGPRGFVGNFQAAGVGITLTRASRVICAEFDWTPAIMEQAEDRARRIGQKSTVFVDILYAQESIDSILLGILNRKREQARLTLDGGRGNGEDVLPASSILGALAELEAIESLGPYGREILRLFSERPQYTRNHLSLLLATIEGERT